jgi:hypothetical protein
MGFATKREVPQSNPAQLPQNVSRSIRRTNLNPAHFAVVRQDDNLEIGISPRVAKRDAENTHLTIAPLDLVL